MSQLLTLLAVLVGAGVSLLTARQTRRWAHQQWLLDKRHEAYADVLRSIFALVEQGAGAPKEARTKLYTGVFTAVIHCRVVASETVDQATRGLLEDVKHWSTTGNDVGRVVGHGGTLDKLMRADLAGSPRGALRARWRFWARRGASG
ncbi:hypothetical protein ABC795_11210 [Blastococcus sp. HT6-30]|uniref:hypothetical protein n=1 Tax=Blastococcus sp. HT6-30 TaxID=3144843 RepID=UPI003218EA97